MKQLCAERRQMHLMIQNIFLYHKMKEPQEKATNINSVSLFKVKELKYQLLCRFFGTIIQLLEHSRNNINLKCTLLSRAPAS